METEIVDSKLIFYYNFLCESCGKTFGHPVGKKVEDLPESIRDEVIDRIKSGAKLTWGLNPSEIEIEKLEKELECPKCRCTNPKYIWPLGC